jgi:hypothetical protein
MSSVSSSDASTIARWESVACQEDGTVVIQLMHRPGRVSSASGAELRPLRSGLVSHLPEDRPDAHQAFERLRALLSSHAVLRLDLIGPDGTLLVDPH